MHIILFMCFTYPSCTLTVVDTFMCVFHVYTLSGFPIHGRMPSCYKSIHLTACSLRLTVILACSCYGHFTLIHLHLTLCVRCISTVSYFVHLVSGEQHFDKIALRGFILILLTFIYTRVHAFSFNTVFICLSWYSHISGLYLLW